MGRRVRRLALGGPELSGEALGEHLDALLANGDAEVMVCDVSAVTDPDLATVDALARLALQAQRRGCRLRLRHPSAQLADLLVLAGLAEVLRLNRGSIVQVRRQAEDGEQPGVQERRDPGHLSG